MGLWQRYITNRLIKLQSTALTLHAQDRNLGAGLLSQSRFADLRMLIREDLQKTQFGVMNGLRYAHAMDELCQQYHTAIICERLIRHKKNEYYVCEALGPRFQRHEHLVLESPIGHMMASFRKPDDRIISFPKGEYGVYECEKYLAALEGSSVPPYNEAEVRKRVDDFYEHPQELDA